ncbi:MAG: response regulator [Symplocastrum torsivum CPER-KK1]|jgi:PAS domain S-box-containing protein|uniref:histidine kinase n=1 Tax=Symplocastrum torsivum CPER-KK1 TaxID=450513 RepID=A0A951UAB6_9CYAN|nr:response regulator [Symplocastrum torsivum CPER-KK1]
MSVGTTNKGVILIVDDTPTNLEVLFDFLADSGFKVLVAEDGETAIERVEYAPPDLVLLDILMPGMDGFETCRCLKANERTKDVPVIFMTALSETVDKVRGLNLGAVDYITKPLQHEEVIARIQLHLSLQKLTKTLKEQNLRLEQEIQERKRSDQKIREQAALLDITTDAIFVQDLENQILYWNKGAERLYGWKAEEAIGKEVEELLYWDSLPQLQHNLNSLTPKGEWQGELHQLTKAGKEIVVATRWTLVRDEDGQPKSILSVNTDVTEKKQLEAQFHRAQRLESIGTLASGIAHDLNNVLAPILMTVQLLQQKLKDQQSQKWLNILETNAKRGAELVKQVLSFARGMAGDRKILQVAHLILEVEKVAKHTFSKSIEIQVDTSAQKLWPILGDPTQLQQVLMNLCVNAQDAMPNGGTLSIVAENIWIDEPYTKFNIEAKVGSYIVLTVSDTGIGIPEETLERIFDPFFTTKAIDKGTGLGLSTVMGIVKSYGGFINVHSQVGKGTQFKIYLPALEKTEIQTPQDRVDTLPIGNGELILVADDETSIREIIKTLLEAFKYRVLLANDGIEAIALYAQHKEEISVVLLDLMMPSLDGSTTIRTLHKMNPQVKIIASSGLMSNHEIIQTLDNSVEAFLQKPYTSDDLLKKLQLVLNESDRSFKLPLTS